MEIRVLRYFLAVANEGNISAAAEQLHITQPTLSRQIMDLENELNTTLFVRSKRGICLTQEGILLRKRAEEIVFLADKTAADIQTTDEEIYGRVSIGSGETDAMRLIAKTAHKLQAKHPHITLDIYSGNADDVTEKLDNGLLDFGLLIEPVDILKYNFVNIPATDVWGVLMRKDSKLATKVFIEPTDLYDNPLIFSSQSKIDKDFTAWFQKDVQLLNIVARYNLFFNASLLVEEGFGYALILDKLANTSNDSCLCFKPLKPEMQVNLLLIWKKYQVFSKASALFLEKMRAVCGHTSTI